MSNDLPFEFTYNDADGEFDPSRTSILGAAINAWAIETYGDDYMVGGLLAFNDDKELVGIRVESYGKFGTDDEPTTTGDGAWERAVEWMHELGVQHLFGFVRRAPAYGHGVEQGAWDAGISNVTASLAGDEDFVYQGFLIVNGDEAEAYAPMDPLELLMQALSQAQPGLDFDIDALLGLGDGNVDDGGDYDVPPAFYQ